MSAALACPGCAALPAEAPAPAAAPAAGATEAIHLALPAIHCAACIRTAEGALQAVPGVASARVNLGQRRARALARPGLGAQPLTDALARAGIEAHELDEAALLNGTRDAAGRDLLMRIAVSGFAMMNVMILSVAVWSGAEGATRELFHWVSAAIALPAVAFAARPFLRGALASLRAGRLGMDVPIALAIVLACLMSLYETAHGGRHAYFDAALSLTFFLLAGRYLDHRARSAARSAAEELSALEVPRATRLAPDGARESVPLAAIAPGDLIAVAAGGRVPVDGIIEGEAGEGEAGAADLDRSALTGESLPVRARTGMPVAAGEAVIGAPLTIRATARAEDSALRRLKALVEVAEGARHRYAPLADRAAALYAPLVHALAAAALAAWWAGTGDLRLAINIATATLIITCPCALGLAVPAVTATVSGRLFRAGLLLKNATALERLAEVDVVLLDKTGTLTTGAADLPDLDDEAAGVALALARASDHPASRAVAAALAGRAPASLTDLREVPGEGMRARWRDAPVALGRGTGGGLALRLPGRPEIPLAIEERLRPGAAEMVARLRADGLEVILVSGDAPSPVAAMAARLGIADARAGMRPEAKAALAADLAAAGRHPLMIGDGLNDAGALAAAHVSVAPAGALDAARAAADAVLLSGDLAAVPGALAEARLAVRRIRQNFAVAAAYNLVAIPVALAGLATPLLAALAMSGSSVTVVLNALRPGERRARMHGGRTGGARMSPLPMEAP